MCGRFTQSQDVSAYIQTLVGNAEVPARRRRYNIAPTDAVAVLVAGESGPAMEWMRWGLVYPWDRDKEKPELCVNTRTESLMKRTFKNLLTTRRCLIPADGFFEWRKDPRRRVPIRYVVKGGGWFFFAGLYDDAADPEKHTAHAFSIITCPPNELVQPVHNRMPVILPQGSEKIWLNPKIKEPEQLIALLGPYPSSSMLSYEVSPAVNSVRNDTPDCVNPVVVLRTCKD